MPNRLLAAALATAFLTLAAGQAFAQGQPPEVRERRNGYEAEFRNGCVVEFDRNGRRKSANGKCGPNQLERAEAAISAGGRNRSSDSADRRGPEVDPQRNGELDVNFPNGCTALYASDGDRKGNNGRCSEDQLARADDAAESYRRQNGIRGDRPGVGPGPRPDIVDRRGGEFDVQFETGCSVYYESDGDRKGNNGRCAKDEINRADAAAERYAESHGGDRDDDDDVVTGPLPDVTTMKDGSPRVEYSNGCVVKFDASSRMTGGSKACTDDQLRRARIAAYEQRRSN